MELLSFREKLEELAEEKYASFSASLIPNCKESIIGVRIPKLRKLAKHIIAQGKGVEYLKIKGDLLFEEKMLKMLIFGNLKIGIDEKLKLAKNLIGEITNWSLCDSFCNEFKDVKIHKEKVWNFLQKFFTSDKTYELRVAVVLGLFYFIDETYLPKLFAKFNAIKSDNYYVQMAVAWGVSMCFVKFRRETLAFLQHNGLNDFTQNKSIQKIKESLQVSKEDKQKINLLKQESSALQNKEI